MNRILLKFINTSCIEYCPETKQFNPYTTKKFNYTPTYKLYYDNQLIVINYSMHSLYIS